MVSGLQIIGTFFGLVLSYFTFLNFKRREFTIREFLGWQVLWIGFIAVTWFPGKITGFAEGLGAVRGIDLFTVLGFMVVLSITFYTYVGLDKLRKKLEKAIRDLALSDIK